MICISSRFHMSGSKGLLVICQIWQNKSFANRVILCSTNRLTWGNISYPVFKLLIRPRNTQVVSLNWNRSSPNCCTNLIAQFYAGGAFIRDTGDAVDSFLDFTIVMYSAKPLRFGNWIYSCLHVKGTSIDADSTVWIPFIWRWQWVQLSKRSILFVEYVAMNKV